ncbi:MAG: hypothetical protein RIT39_389 [Bacteroidota bacterium]
MPIFIRLVAVKPFVMLQCFQNSIFTRFGRTSAILALVLCAQVTLAQPPPPDDPNNVGGGTGGAGVPIDGGLSILLAAGAGLGLKKAWDARKRNFEENNTVL